jgi:hypothetical protein
MALTVSSEMLQDESVIAIACAVAIANKKAQEAGIETTKFLISATQDIEENAPIWRVDYIPKDYINKRGGGFSVEIDAQDGHIIRALRSQ